MFKQIFVFRKRLARIILLQILHNIITYIGCHLTLNHIKKNKISKVGMKKALKLETTFVSFCPCLPPPHPPPKKNPGSAYVSSLSSPISNT